MDSSFLRNSLRTATIFIQKVTIHVVESGVILQLVRLLLFELNSFHNVQILPYFLLMSDSFLVFVHQPIQCLIHSIFQFILEICLHIHYHCVQVLPYALVLRSDWWHQLPLFYLLFLKLLSKLPLKSEDSTRLTAVLSLICLRISLRHLFRSKCADWWSKWFFMNLLVFAPSLESDPHNHGLSNSSDL